MKTDCGSQWQN